MTATATRPPRRTEDICPPWCEGHSGGYQGWETYDDGQKRDHGECTTVVGNAIVMLVQTEHEDHTLEAPIVALYVEDNADLSPAQARELAAALVEKAAQAEAQR